MGTKLTEKDEASYSENDFWFYTVDPSQTDAEHTAGTGKKIKKVNMLLASGFPYACVRTLIGTAGGAVTLSSNVDVLFNPLGSTSELPPEMNNLFEDVGDHKARYIGETPALFLLRTFLKGRLNSGGQGGERSYAVNDLIREYTRSEVSLSQATVGGNNHFGRLILQKGDVFSTYMKCIGANKSWVGGQVQMFATFEGYVTEDILGSELFLNPDLISVSGFTGVNATISNPSAGEILAEATSTASSVDVSVSGLTIGKRYRMVVPAKRGSQGTEQSIDSIDFGTIISSPILLTSTKEFVFDIEATAVSGDVNVIINSTGASGDEVVFNSQFSIKEYIL